MIKEFSELGKRIREQNADSRIIHDAIKEEPMSIDLIIKEDGSFDRFAIMEKRMTQVEAITAKKGKARLLLDKVEEVLGYGGETKKHDLFLKKIEEYSHIQELKPVIAFYNDSKMNGINKALFSFEEQVDEKERKGNIAFRISSSNHRIHEEQAVIQEIINKYEADQKSKLKGNSKSCSLCGRTDYPVENKPHGMIKRVPDGQMAGCALVSYNERAFESYGLVGNFNSSICTNCARTYVEGLNWLLSNGSEKVITDGKGKEKLSFKYNNRKNFGSDTAILFWTKRNQTLSEIDMLDEPDSGAVAILIDSFFSGDNKVSQYLDDDLFYSCTLSGAAARIAIRDWIELSLPSFKREIAHWFQDIAIERYNFEQKKSEILYSRFFELVECTKNKKVKGDTSSSRIAVHLWNAALKGTIPPIWILSAVLKRVRVMESDENKRKKDSVTQVRAALIRLVLNRNSKGGKMIQEKLDETNSSPAYVCGRIFAMLESIQRAALGKNVNAGIRERFFSFASTNPSPAFGRLMKMSQNHLTKLKTEKYGLAVVLDKELQELFCLIQEFPAVFSLEQQGQFAIGYYHQKQSIFSRVKEKPELKEVLEDDSEMA
ncbi:type I-C CRISPR-associated protein Cas8c/Csd1 [bacterium]|nr:type I-C CRISPR-associated protein Cas8c/Csd1 [bacterium]